MSGAPGDDPALHELDPLGRFTGRAADYVRFRPDYPAAAIDAMLDGLGPADAVRAADVGAGTGISARALADRGVHVVAIEPNREMRESAAQHPRVTWREGTAEATGLPEAEFDLVACAQAFHWFRGPEAVAEFRRILRPGGRLAILWNNRDRGDPLTRGFIEAIHAIQGEHPAERRAFDPAVVAAGGAFTEVQTLAFPHAQSLDREGLVGRALSASYVPREGERHAALVAALERLFERHGDAHGRVSLRYVTHVHVATRR